MKSFAGSIAFGAALALLAGCSAKRLQPNGGGSGGIGTIGSDGGAVGGSGADGSAATGAGGAAAGGGAADAGWDVNFGGRRSFVVTSNVQADGGAQVSHTFTMTVDSDKHLAIIGMDGSTVGAPVEQTADGALRISTTLAFGVPVTGACGGSVVYDEVTFTIDASNHLAGTGRGQLNIIDPSMGHSTDVTMRLLGVLDSEPPTFSLSAAGDLADPWTPFWLVSSEPMPTRSMVAALESEGGDLMWLTVPTGMEIYMTELAKPTTLLRFGDQYVVTTAGLTDLAGNTRGGDLTFTTRPPPPLAAADGFESITDASFGGAQVLSGAGAPVIAGTRSLYIPPADSLPSFVTQLAVRLAIAPGDTDLLFSYRTVNPNDGNSINYVIASVGGAIETIPLPSDGGSPTTPAVIGQTQVLLGATRTATIALPPDARDEVVLARVAWQPSYCGGPAPQPVPGIIIDDLHAE